MSHCGTKEMPTDWSAASGRLRTLRLVLRRATLRLAAFFLPNLVLTVLLRLAVTAFAFRALLRLTDLRFAAMSNPFPDGFSMTHSPR
jgi:hypothetical protein